MINCANCNKEIKDEDKYNCSVNGIYFCNDECNKIKNKK